MSKRFLYLIVVLVTFLTGCLIGKFMGMSHEHLSPNAQEEFMRAEIQTRVYQEASVITWEDEDGVKIEAKVDMLAEPAKHTNLPTSRLTLKNLNTNQIIYERDEDRFLISMYEQPLHDMDTLIIKWSGGSADRLEILAVDSKQAHDIFFEAYRLDAALIDLDGNNDDGDADVLITTADGGGMSLYVERYVWKEGKYQKAGRVSYAKLVKELGKEFK